MGHGHDLFGMMLAHQLGRSDPPKYVQEGFPRLQFLKDSWEWKVAPLEDLFPLQSHACPVVSE